MGAACRGSRKCSGETGHSVSGNHPKNSAAGTGTHADATQSRDVSRANGSALNLADDECVHLSSHSAASTPPRPGRCVSAQDGRALGARGWRESASAAQGSSYTRGWHLKSPLLHHRGLKTHTGAAFETPRSFPFKCVFFKKSWLPGTLP